ncbi:MAG: fumarate reductase subunit C [Hyphomicrobiaceae bacterium]
MKDTVPRNRPYVRPMHRWWLRDPFFVRYMVRELTAFAVLIYAVVLMVGMLRLSQGQAAWDGWLAAMRTPPSLVLHAVLLVAMIVHACSWFEIMPKTMPTPVVGGGRVAQATITRVGWAASAGATVMLLALYRWWAS